MDNKTNLTYNDDMKITLEFKCLRCDSELIFEIGSPKMFWNHYVEELNGIEGRPFGIQLYCSKCGNLQCFQME